MEDFDVADLSDDELKQMLVKNGFEPGPIVKTTRKIYEKRLIKILQGKNKTTSDHTPTPIVQTISASPRKKEENVADSSKEKRQLPSRTLTRTPTKPTNVTTSSPDKPSNPISPATKLYPHLNIVKLDDNKNAEDTDDDRMEGEESYRFIPNKAFVQTSKVIYDGATAGKGDERMEGEEEFRRRPQISFGQSSYDFGAGTTAVRGCSYCDGLDHSISDCPKLDASKTKRARISNRKDNLTPGTWRL